VTMGIFRDVLIKYEGVDYKVTPSARLLRLIESKGRRDDPRFNLAMSVYRMTMGDVSYGDISFILAELVNSAGAKTTPDAAWAYMQELDLAKLQELIEDLSECFIAPSVQGKKPEPPETPEA
jgi:hypothetical protein